MTSGAPEPTVDELLDRYIDAWHAGAGPSAADYVAQAAPDDREELGAMIAGFLELAPTVPLTADAAAEKASDPLVARLADLEAARWEAADGVAAAGELADDARGRDEAAEPGGASTGAGPGSGADADQADSSGAHADTASWGARLRAERTIAGVSLTQLAHAFAQRFGLGRDDAGRAPTVLAELEAGALPAGGVTARAARALEELLGSARGTLDTGAEPAHGGALMRSDTSTSDAEREQLGELLRHLDDALPSAGADEPGETLSDLLGA